jgi:NTP pyrophosphatase (non-canonical NTP hydrolase)
MQLNDYQRWARGKCGTPPAANAMGLAGEAGEAVDLLKKIMFHGKLASKDALAKELGDVLWYLANVAADHGLTLQSVADLNIDKLERRYPHGFSAEQAEKRKDEQP